MSNTPILDKLRDMSRQVEDLLRTVEDVQGMYSVRSSGAVLTEMTGHLPPYRPTWVASEVEGHSLWVVFDQSEGFQPAYALVFADDAGDAAEIGQELAGRKRLDTDSESLVVQLVHGWS